MNIVLRPLSVADFAPVAALARRVWQATYADLIPQAQIDQMLAARYSPDGLGTYLSHCGQTLERWFDLACLGSEKGGTSGEIAGFCACEIYRGEYKLDKLYVANEHQRLGIGARLIAAAGERGRALGHDHMILAVNKKNAQAIAAYTKHGFSVREAVCVDIGNGFVMDDFIMQKKL